MRRYRLGLSRFATGDRLWALPPVVTGLAVLMLGAWTGRIVLPNPLAEQQRAVAAQVDQEDADLCRKFGLVLGTPAHLSCKQDLLELRQHDQMVQTTEF